MTETPRHSVSVAAAIFDEAGEKVLVIKRRENGKWEPPGGVLELGETIEDGLRREVREETGAEIAVGPLTGVYKNMSLGIVALVFHCTLSSAFSDTTTEARRVCWLSTADVTSLMPEAYFRRILDARQSQKAQIRAHDGNAII